MSRRSRKPQEGMSRRDFFRRATCASVTMASVYSMVRDLRLINSAAADGLPTDYKALICLFLYGGHDANNMLVMRDDTATEYQLYATHRKGLSIPRANLISLNPIAGGNPPAGDGGTHNYGLHPNMQGLADLFNGYSTSSGTKRKAALLCNVGTLVQPITRAQYYANPRLIPIPQQLFSHNDQVIQWQTSISDRDSPTGWGGRMADLLNAANTGTVSMNISLSGINTFEVGKDVNVYISNTSGPIGLDTGTSNGVSLTTANGSTGPLVALNNSLIPAPATAPQLNLYEKAYAETTKRGIDAFNSVNSAIAATSASNYFTTPFTFMYPTTYGGTPVSTSSGLMNQLKMVARLIAGRNTLGHKRQIFFVSVGGYDLHDTQVQVTDSTDPLGTNPLWGPHAKLMAEISQCIWAFQKAMDQLHDNGNMGATDKVTLFTASDFGRTFPMNGTYGSDHGWGNHHIIVGDDVIGGQFKGTFPRYSLSTGDDTTTGRWIPRTSVDEYAATLAKWYGVSSANMNQVLPNLYRFVNPDLGFMVQPTPSEPIPSEPIVLASAVEPAPVTTALASSDSTDTSSMTMSSSTTTKKKPKKR